jgi:hypothetical protein
MNILKINQNFTLPRQVQEFLFFVVTLSQDKPIGVDPHCCKTIISMFLKNYYQHYLK